MSDDKVEKADAKKEKKGKSNLIPAVVLALGIAAGGYFMGGSSSDAASADAKPAVEKPTPGEIATMDPLSVNLADGHFLKVDRSLGQLDRDPAGRGNGRLGLHEGGDLQGQGPAHRPYGGPADGPVDLP